MFGPLCILGIREADGGVTPPELLPAVHSSPPLDRIGSLTRGGIGRLLGAWIGSPSPAAVLVVGVYKINKHSL